MSVAPPRRFADTPPDMVHRPSGLRVWFIEPIGILTQVSEQTRADVAMARFLSGPVTERLFGLRRDSKERVLILHEWSSMAGYTRETRVEMTQWGLQIRTEIDRILVSLGPGAPSLVRMGVSVAATALTMAGIRLTLVADMDEVVEELSVRPRQRADRR